MRNVLGGWTADLTDRRRILLALKTALAAGLAYYVAPYVPFAEDSYSYYAPLGVLVSMYPTLAGSARSGMQALLGLAVGIALGLIGIGAVLLGVPALVMLAILVGLGVLLGGVRVFGAGRDWVAIAAVFILLLSGDNAEGYSLSYLVTMAFGVVVGVAVNFLIIPPLYLDRASARLTVLRTALSDRLHALGDAVRAADLDTSSHEDDMAELARTVDAVRADVVEADESRRGNPRGRNHRAAQDQNAERMRALDRTTFFTQDLSDVLVRMAGRDDPSLSAPVRESFADAIHRCGDLVATPVGHEDAAGQLETAATAVDRYLDALDAASRGLPSVSADEVTAAVCLRRIVDASRPLV